MELIIHAGTDKSGSTAIQAHMSFYRSWFLDNGVYIPTTGLTGFGHLFLFRDLSASNWSPLLAELQRAREDKYSRYLLSWEGACFFSNQAIEFLREQLKDFDVKILFYLRPQAEIIQSGYLQQLKERRQNKTLAHFEKFQPNLTPDNRDYLKMLMRFESVFGKSNIFIRAYASSELKHGNIVLDFLDFLDSLDFLDCETDRHFIPSQGRQNISLDVQAARILNVYDSLSKDTVGRGNLVDDLLWLIERDGGGNKLFLNENVADHIQEHYRKSNAALLERYSPEAILENFFPKSSSSCNSRSCAGTESNYIAELSSLSHSPRWQGDALSGDGLMYILQDTSGWSCFEAWGAWSLGKNSSISFRVPKHRISGVERSLTLTFQGRYHADSTSTQVTVNTSHLGDLDLRDCSIDINMDQLDDNRIIKIELQHAAPALSGRPHNKDADRQLAFGLEQLSYHIEN